MAGDPVEDEVVVVGRHDLGEADRIVRLVTRGHGRVDAVARGARRSRKRFGGVLDPGTRGLARWHKGRGDLATLVELSEARGVKRPREDWTRLALLAYGCEVVGVLCGPAPEPRLHRLLLAWLDLLEGEAQPDDASRVALEGKALTFAGTAPALLVCPRCGEPLAGAVRFDMEAGGGVHGGCGTGPRVQASSLAVADDLRRTPLANTPGREVPADVRWLLSDFVRYQSGAPLRSRASLAPPEVP